MTKRRIMLTITSSCLQLAAPFLNDEADADDEEFDEDFPIPPAADGELPEPSELLTEGYLVTTPQRVEILYEETELSGMAGSVTTIGFDRAAPGLISMMRSGPVRSTLMFEKGKRHTSLYDTPFASFEICSHTLNIENKLLSQGTIRLEYLLSFHGAAGEHCKLSISIRPIEEA